MNTLDEQMKAGEDALAEAARTLAKADDLAGLEGDLDEDFEDYDASADAADQADEAAIAEEEAAEAAGDEGEFVDNDGLDGQPAPQDAAGDEGATEEEAPAPEEDGDMFAKAGEVEVTDATPFLQALQESVTLLAKAVDSLEGRIAVQEATRSDADRAMLAALQSQQASLTTLAKAQGVISNTPLRPKSQGGGNVTVPTAVTEPQGNLNDLFAKAYDVVSDPGRIGVLEHYYNRGDRNGMLNALTPDERSRVGN